MFQTDCRSEVKAEGYWIPRRRPGVLEYDPRQDPTYDPERNIEHPIHQGCDILILSVEGMYARKARAWERARSSESN